MIKNSLLFTGLAFLIGCQGVDAVVDETSTELAAACDYAQVYGNASHAGIACPEVVNMEVVKVITQDPDANAENDFSGFLQIHESAPLTSGDYVLVPSKSGYVNSLDRSPERYHVQAFRWSPSVTAPGATLEEAWKLDTDWQPVDGVIASFGYVTNGYVQQFQPAIANGSVYMPGRNGKIIRASLATGAVQAVINPFEGTPFDGDSRLLVNNAISFDALGNVYYTAVAWPLGTPNISAQPRGTWLVQVSPANTARLVEWDSIASPAVGVPGATDLCEFPFGTAGTPLATGPSSRAPRFGCGRQRPAINAPIAVDPRNGNLVAWSYANNAQGAAFLVEIDALTLTPIRAADTRDILLHGCGKRLRITGAACNTITAGGTVNLGFDPAFNGPVRFRGIDLMASAPTVAPNGDWSIGSYDGGFAFGGNFDSRGAGIVFRNGAFHAKNETFFWEVTPSVWEHDGTFSYLQDRQQYSLIDLTVAQFSEGQAPEAIHQIPTDFSAVAIDFLDAHIPFGPTGDRYGVNGDGHLYKFTAASKGPVEVVALTNADGSVRSMETLAGYFARDRAGRIYASYAGNVYVIASGAAPTVQARRELSPAARAKLEIGRKAKRVAADNSPMPMPAAEPTAEEMAAMEASAVRVTQEAFDALTGGATRNLEGCQFWTICNDSPRFDGGAETNGECPDGHIGEDKYLCCTTRFNTQCCWGSSRPYSCDSGGGPISPNNPPSAPIVGDPRSE